MYTLTDPRIQRIYGVHDYYPMTMPVVVQSAISIRFSSPATVQQTRFCDYVR